MYCRKGATYRRLLLDNNNNPLDKYATIDEVGMTEFEFDEVHLLNQAALQVRDTGTGIRIDIRQLVGDRSGLLHIHGNQHLTAEYEESVLQAFLSGVNFIIDKDGEILFPGITYIYGEGISQTGYTEDRSLSVYGRLTGISTLVLGFETLMYLGKDAHTAMQSNGSYLYLDQPGNVTFGSIDLRGKSSILYAPDVPMVASVGWIDVRYKANISAESIYLQTGTLNIEAGSRMTTSAADRPLDTIDSNAGAGFSTNSADVASGGGHASVGGNVLNSTGGIVHAGGDYYGSLYRPSLRGSAGGSSSIHMGGKGGGVVDLTIASHLLVDGDIAADGSSGDTTSGNANRKFFL